MPQFLPLFLPSPLLEFVDKTKVERDTKALKDYFEGKGDGAIKQTLNEENEKWKTYLEELAKPRRKKLFDAETRIPEEQKKIERLVNEGNSLAKELQKIISLEFISAKTLPLRFLEAKKKEYYEVKSKPHKGVEQHLDWIISTALAEIYYPEEFFANRIFKMEHEYLSFPFDFVDDILGSYQLYIWYLIFKKKGPEHFFDNVQDVIVNRYVVRKFFSMSAYALLSFFMDDGNDKNECNRFFTRRMKKDISREAADWEYLVNQIDTKYEEDSFRRFFLANPKSNCGMRDPFQQVVDSEPGLIEQAIYNHLIGNYAASVNLLFPIIEGICWDISVAEHLTNGRIYTAESNLKTRDLRNRVLINEVGQPVPVRHGAPTFKELLEQTRMKDIFHTEFLRLICSELFPDERNPILHGVMLDYTTAFQSARLLLVLEYLHRLIKKKGYHYPEQLDPEGYWTPEKSKED